jgi:hypothetical protein
MAKKDVYYFSHDANSRRDEKIISMRLDYGVEGYGRYFIILEIMREKENYKIELNKNSFRSLAYELNIKPDEVKTFIEDCVKEYELFFIDEQNFLCSESFLNRMETYNDMKEKKSIAGKKGAKKRWQNNSTAITLPMAKHEKSDSAITENGKEKEMKENEIKLNENKKNETDDFFGDDPTINFNPKIVQLFEYWKIKLNQKGFLDIPKADHLSLFINNYSLEDLKLCIDTVYFHIEIENIEPPKGDFPGRKFFCQFDTHIFKNSSAIDGWINTNKLLEKRYNDIVLDKDDVEKDRI